MLFMKGDAARPQCGFSNKVYLFDWKLNLLILSRLLAYCNERMLYLKRKFNIFSWIEFYFIPSFDILSDEEVRQGLKKYSNWPTFPQLYFNGELIGGLDIVSEMVIIFCLTLEVWFMIFFRLKAVNSKKW